MTARQISLFEPVQALAASAPKEPVLRILRALLRSPDPAVRFADKAA